MSDFRQAFIGMIGEGQDRLCYDKQTTNEKKMYCLPFFSFPVCTLAESEDICIFCDKKCFYLLVQYTLIQVSCSGTIKPNERKCFSFLL